MLGGAQMAKINDLTEKELRRLGRRDLLALLLEQSKELDELEQRMQAERTRHAQETEELRQRHLEELKRLKETSGERIDLLTSRVEFEKERRRMLENRDRRAGNRASAAPAIKSIYRAITKSILSGKKEALPGGLPKKGAGK